MSLREQAIENERQKAAQQTQEQANSAQGQQVLNNYMTNPLQGFSLYGTAEEQNNQIAQLSQVGALTGQNIAGIGQDATQYRDLLQQRLMSADPQSQYMMDQRNRNVANVGRQMAGRGVAGGVAAASVNQAQREADSQVNSQMFSNQRANQVDLDKMVQRRQKITGEAIAAGSERGLANSTSVDVGQGTIPCFILVSMGLMSSELYAKEAEVLIKLNPTVVETYRSIVPPLAKKMKSDINFAKKVRPLAIAWAEERTGENPNVTGKVLKYVGEPSLYILGKVKAFLCL